MKRRKKRSADADQRMEWKSNNRGRNSATHRQLLIRQQQKKFTAQTARDGRPKILLNATFAQKKKNALFGTHKREPVDMQKIAAGASRSSSTQKLVIRTKQQQENLADLLIQPLLAPSSPITLTSIVPTNSVILQPKNFYWFCVAFCLACSSHSFIFHSNKKY